MKISKYEFNSREQFLSKFNALHTEDEKGNNIPNFEFAIVELGNVLLKKGEYNEDGKEIKKPVISKKYHIDAAWMLKDTFTEDGDLEPKDHPYGWKTYNVDYKVKEGQGLHSFLGIDYQKNKF